MNINITKEKYELIFEIWIKYKWILDLGGINGCFLVEWVTIDIV